MKRINLQPLGALIQMLNPRGYYREICVIDRAIVCAWFSLVVMKTMVECLWHPERYYGICYGGEKCFDCAVCRFEE